MEQLTKISEIRKALEKVRRQGKTIGFVPTMGYLHEGHLSLVRESLKKADYTVVSIFVNPTQFGPEEDFNRYPRDLSRDAQILEKEGVDILFVPQTIEMYPEGYKTFVEVKDLQNLLCGKSRPGHFRGVCTVVLKLFNIIQPNMCFFGQKDAQQAVIMKKMVHDLNLDISVEVLPIIREHDGIAMSSRNSYLNPEQRKAALILYKSLKEAEEMIVEGERSAGNIIERMCKIINSEPKARIDYVEIVDLKNLNPVIAIKNEVLIALAVFIGSVRLIDNIIVNIKE
ncbi:MAG: pantoate--beta-alanine ligase [Candidatus Aminicenantes bacterium]|nr:pantoate--beta-alanine ligase [Candidatus Aminicenantes bacterium]